MIDFRFNDGHGHETRYQYQQFPDGKFGFCWAVRAPGWVHGDPSKQSKVYLYEDETECKRDLAHNLKNRALLALGLPEED